MMVNQRVWLFQGQTAKIPSESLPLYARAPALAKLGVNTISSLFLGPLDCTSKPE